LRLSRQSLRFILICESKNFEIAMKRSRSGISVVW
jgi:hypothetical protein